MHVLPDQLHVPLLRALRLFFFFFNDTATTEIYTLSLHDALPICPGPPGSPTADTHSAPFAWSLPRKARSEEHTSELQSPCNLVCRLLLEKKKHTTPAYCRHPLSCRFASAPRRPGGPRDRPTSSPP